MANNRRLQAEIRELRHAMAEMKTEQDNLRDILSQTERRVLAASSEAEEAKIRAEEEEKEKERLEIARKEEIQRQKIELVSEIPQVHTYDF